MEIDYERPNDLSNDEALQLISAFFPLEWKQLKETDISIKRCQTGINNKVYFVTRNTGNGTREPNKLAIRKYVGLSTALGAEGERPCCGMAATRMEEIIVMSELSNRSLGPKIYGIFDEGRIEEYIDCHQMTQEESLDPQLQADLARNMARMHATPVPLSKPGYLFIQRLNRMLDEMKEHQSLYEKIGDQEMLRILAHDWKSDFEMMTPLMNLNHNRIVTINWDAHHQNLAVKNNPPAGTSKTMIFDFELAACNIRGKDLGVFLMSRSGYFPSTRDDRQVETNEQFFVFLKAYQDECVKQFPDFDTHGRDSLDHLMIESLLGGMVSCLCFLFLTALLVAKSKGEGVVIVTLMKFMPPLFQGFVDAKKALKERYPDAGKMFSS